MAAEAYPHAVTGDACPTDAPTRGRTWPPLPGEYQVLDAGGHVAVCVLTSKPLMDAVTSACPPHVAIVGTLFTENLGIERVITNVLANPNLTALVVCGADSEQRIGHRSGQSLLSLMEHGVDERGRIREAKGRRPVLRNLPPETIETFRREVTVIDRLGEEGAETMLEVLAAVPSPNGSRSAFVSGTDEANVVLASPDLNLVLDPNGYFVLFPDRIREVILVEHYANDGSLAHALTGRTAHELYAAIIDRELVSRLDHAAYLGTELARAERCLETGEPYVQDRAPEPPCGDGCGCHPTSGTEGE
jgi:tetrahydromethanopterin S-methyltransferase subunit A